MSVSAYEPSSHIQKPSPAAFATAMDSWENEDTAASVSAAEVARQHQPLDDNKVLGEEPTVPPSTPPQTSASPAAQPTASPSTPYPVQEPDNAVANDVTLQHLSLQTESRALPEAWEVNSSNGLSQSEHALIDSMTGVLSSSSEDDALPSSVEGEPEGKAQKAVKAETLAFQASFAQAAAAGKADGTAGVDFATAGQRTEVWHTMRQSRLTASAFANALGYGLVGSLMTVLQTRISRGVVTKVVMIISADELTVLRSPSALLSLSALLTLALPISCSCKEKKPLPQMTVLLPTTSDTTCA